MNPLEGPGPTGPLVTGSVVWVDLAPTRGREQDGRRPAVVVAGAGYLAAVTSLVILLPVTTVDRGWPNHVRLRGAVGLDRPSWAMTEQIRTVARERITRVVGVVDDATVSDVQVYLRDFLGL